MAEELNGKLQEIIDVDVLWGVCRCKVSCMDIVYIFVWTHKHKRYLHGKYNVVLYGCLYLFIIFFVW